MPARSRSCARSTGPARSSAQPGWLRGCAFPDRPTRVGGVDLPYPLILAAGLVKGDGFAAEEEALAAVRGGRDIVPGWRSVPALVGPVEFGSYTRHPRLGNSGRVLWRDSDGGWMQNRVGLRNPGARAAAAFLARHAAALAAGLGPEPGCQPGRLRRLPRAVTRSSRPPASSRMAFAGLEAGPSWLTLNLSCPNTEDDPRGLQSAELARAARRAPSSRRSAMPVWVKIGPDLSDEQLSGAGGRLRRDRRARGGGHQHAGPACARGAGVAGVSGSRLRPSALDTVTRLERIIDRVRAAPRHRRRRRHPRRHRPARVPDGRCSSSHALHRDGAYVVRWRRH